MKDIAMRFEAIFELNSAEKKDCFQQKSIKFDAADQSDARVRAKNEAKKLGNGWHVLFVRPLDYWRR